MAVPSPPDRLRVCILGGPLVDGFEDREVGTRKARTLVRVLAVARGRPVRTERLVECVWGQQPPAEAADQLSVLVSRLRRVLGPPRLQRRSTGYSLSLDAFDADELETLIDDAFTARAEGRDANAGDLAERALTMFVPDGNGEDDDETFLRAERVNAARCVERALVLMADIAISGGLPERAVALGERALAADPFDESALRVVMRAHTAAGRPAVALHTYVRVRNALADELGVTPSPATEALHDAIVLQQPTEPRSGVGLAVVGLAGRTAELQELHDALTAVTPGRVHYVDVVGEPGIGKTALLREWGRHVNAVFVACGRAVRTLPLQPLLDSFAAIDRSRLLHGTTLLDRMLGFDSPGDDPPLSFLGGGVFADADLVTAMTAIVERLGTEVPVVLIVDDAHSADPMLIDVLDRFLTRHPAAGGLVVTGRQPGRTLRLPPPDRRLDLLPLDLAGVREIVGQRRATAIFERSRGHPLFVVELAAAAPDAPLPDSLVESMRARTDALGDAAVTLRSAAVLGTDIDIDLLSAVTATAAAITFAHIENALGSRLVQERSRDFVFGHDLVREAIAASTTATRRAFLHREAAHWLDRQPAADPLRIAHHARLGGDLALAAHALGQAASLATERWAWAEAENMLDEALTLSADSSLRTARARVRLARADHDGALDDARAAALAGAGAEALELAGWAAYYKRDIAAATTLAQDGVSLATSDGQRARCLLLEGRIFHSNGNLTRADELFISAERLAEPEDVVAAHIWRGALLAHTGHSVEALSALGVVDHAPAVAKQPYANLHATLARAQAYALQGRSSEALRLLTTLHHDLAERGVVRFAGRIDNWKGWVLRNIGATGEADECNERALAAASSNGLHEAWANALLDLADAAIRRVDLADADRLLAEAAGQEAHGHAFRWRHTQRRSLLEARRHLAAGEEGRAGEALSELRKAGVLPTDRYGAITSILQARVDVRLGAPVNHASLMPTITALQTQAGLEAWWLVGELAADLGSEPVWQIAASMLNDLTMRADDRSSVTGHVNGRVLDALRPR